MDYAEIRTETEEEFARAGAGLLERLIAESIGARGRCILGLSGGSTPRVAYETLGKSRGIDWSKVWVFLVDERFADRDSAESNERLVRDTLLAGAKVPPMQFKRPGMLNLPDWIDEYDETLAELLAGSWPDVVTLGMGEDGHIASLFPPVQEEGFGPRLTVHTVTDRFAVRDRVSVTMPMLANAGAKVFLLKGEGKKRIWNEMLASEEGERRWPAKAVLASGNVTAVTQW